MPESIANKIPQHTDHCLQDTTKPPTIKVEWARFADFLERSTNNRRDPLVIYLANVEPRCTIEILNLSARPDGKWGKDGKKLPFDLDRCLPDGKISARQIRQHRRGRMALPSAGIARRLSHASHADDSGPDGCARPDRGRAFDHLLSTCP